LSRPNGSIIIGHFRFWNINVVGVLQTLSNQDEINSSETFISSLNSWSLISSFRYAYCIIACTINLMFLAKCFLSTDSL
jgi:hypothetical protein